MSHRISFPAQNISSEQIEELLFLAENVARNYVQKRIPSKEIKNFEIVIEFDNTAELSLDCTIDLELIKHSKFDPQKIIEESLEKIFEVLEKELKIKSE
jgi:Protein of unknown function (DUF3194)